MTNPAPPFEIDDLPPELRPSPPPPGTFAEGRGLQTVRLPNGDGTSTVVVLGGDIQTQQAGNPDNQADTITPSNLVNPNLPVYNVDLWIWFITRGCSDPDTCSGGQRKSSGYTWYIPISPRLSDGSLTEDEYGLHMGIALGGHRGLATWYTDWSGYFGGDHEYAPLRGESIGTGKMAQGITIEENHWYQLRIWRTDCSPYDPSPDDLVPPGQAEPDGPVYGWSAWIIDTATGNERFSGEWCLHASTINDVAYFVEIIEPAAGTGPCDTDFWGSHQIYVQYRDAAGLHYFPDGWGYYGDACPDTNPPDLQTNWRGVNPSMEYTINDRETERGSGNGGILDGGQAW